MSHQKYAVFTMDVEAFSHTECVRNAEYDADADLMDGFDAYIRILEDNGIKSTLFTVGTLAPKIADRLHRCMKNGHCLALHSYDHIAPMEQTPEVFRAQTRKAKQALSRQFNTPVVGYRAPCFSMDARRLEILRELGFHYDSSHLDFLPASHTVKLDLSSFRKLRDGIFRKDGFYEFGLAKQRLLGFDLPISGGGYVRLGKWDVMKGLIRRHIHTCDYYVFYLHPFELTMEAVPKIKGLKFYDRLYLHAGIKSYAGKIRQIIEMLRRNGFQFVTFEELTEILNRETSPQ